MSEPPSGPRRVSYQAMLRRDVEAAPLGGYVSLRPEAIATRRKSADRDVNVTVSKAQRRWLREVEELSGRGIDRAAVVRALLDLGMELEVDWAVLAGGKALRAAVREAVLVRRAHTGAEQG